MDSLRDAERHLVSLREHFEENNNHLRPWEGPEDHCDEYIAAEESYRQTFNADDLIANGVLLNGREFLEKFTPLGSPFVLLARSDSTDPLATILREVDDLDELRDINAAVRGDKMVEFEMGERTCQFDNYGPGTGWLLQTSLCKLGLRSLNDGSRT